MTNNAKPGMVGSLWGGIRKRLAGDSGALGLVLADQVLVSLVNFLTGVLIGRLAAPEQLGLYTLGWTTVVVAYEIQAALIVTPYTFKIAGLSRERLAAYTGSMLAFQLCLSLFACLLVLGLAFSLAKGLGGPELARVFLALCLALFFLMTRDFARRVALAWLEPRVVLRVDGTACLAQALGLALLFSLGGGAAWTAYLVIGLANAAGFLVFLRMPLVRLVLEPSQWLPHFKETWRFSRWTLASGLTWSAGMYLYPWLIAGQYGAKAAGIWGAAFAIVNATNPLVLGVSNYLAPKIARVRSELGGGAFLRVIVSYSLWFALGLTPAVAVLAFWGGELVALIYGPAFGGAGAAVLFLGLNLWTTVLVFTTSRALFAENRPKLDFWANLGGVVFAFLAGAWMVAQWGVAGGAAALFSTNLLFGLARLAMVHRVARRREARDA